MAVLIEAVEQAKCNGGTGLKYKKVVPINDQTHRAVYENLANELQLDLDSASAMHQLMTDMPPEFINQVSDEELNKKLVSLSQTGKIIGGQITGLVLKEFATWDENRMPLEFTDLGIALIRATAAQFKTIEID
ncbi:hypothetical protein D3C84_353730 [compost metagenome]